MTTLHPMPDGVVLVAIDIAKSRNEVLIEVPGAKRRRRMTVLNTREEHDRLIACQIASNDDPLFAPNVDPSEGGLGLICGGA